MEISIWKKGCGLYYWKYIETGKIHDTGIICTSYNHWKTKRACIKNAIKFSESLQVPCPVVDCTLKYRAPWSSQGIKFNP